MTSTHDLLITTITSALHGEGTVHILDPREDGIHLEAHVISDQFEGLSLLKRHQIVMQSLKNHFSSFLHALSLKTYTTKEWNLKQEGQEWIKNSKK